MIRRQSDDFSGKLYIGVSDDGTVEGLDNPNETSLQISNMVRDAIKPDLTMFLHYETVTVDEKKIVAVDIQQGTERPYYIAKKGLRPEGVYVRQGYSSVPATNTVIRRMIKETDGDHFEEMRSLEQKLTFESAKKYLPNGIVFQGTTQSEFKDRKEFSGSLFRQMDEAYEFIDFRNQTHATFDKLYRIDKRDYPEAAVREALLNLLVHREYSFRASTFISLYADRLEFTSIGGLVSGVSLKDITMGISVCRNTKLANVFYRLELIEAYGTGIIKIMEAYEGTGMTPQIKTSDNAFKIILPNLNAMPEPARQMQVNPEEGTPEEKVIALTEQRGFVTRKEIEILLGMGQSSCGRLLKKMIENGLLIQEGKGKNIRYCLPQ
ncbi:hypothetical protein C817_03426 [Dorea sp. 5-2]|nr:hypothetical protein C817_03426 [Dorea sp. 5-2]